MEKHGLGSYQIDIREIVQLSHSQLPIEEIEEMEIIPQIVIEENGAEIEIIGSLFLYGDYKGNQEAGKLDPTDELPETYEESVQFEPLSADRGPYSPLAKQDRFEYRIPVKITMPRNKVAEVDDVYAYINSFDYELKTPYQVEVVASLMISGFTEEKAEQPEEESWNAAPLEFVHTAGDQWNEDFQAYYNEQLQALQQEFEPIVQEQTPAQEQQEPVAVSHRAESEPTTLPPMQEEHEPEESVQEAQEALESPESPESPETPESPAVQEVPQKVPKQTEPFEKLRPSEEEPEAKAETEWSNVVPLPTLPESPREDAVEGQEEIEEQEVQEEQQEQEQEDEKDVRVAISNKGTKQDQEPISSLASIFSRIPKKEAKKEEEQTQRSETGSQASEAGREDNDALYLTNFMDNQAEQFTKVRICIIQKNETIEEIAERYAMTVDAILRANGAAARNQVASGQLLYIPVKG
ncbi:LysM peptidoglycan-binding domain-containing protein [Ammoniphilus sp. YIM 78166]|uniref:LysM peptidoglycan-binding domain-containing protein n=1 Tax=Ammoniphilus sp. YIM 78166 TaxID=1644106 RepID=UPI00106F9B73|nr:LysM peptidoglycan-binding domain-containing protein [Ammoniphilus sp. YIM 78166]